jgi:hypothetical protein
MARAEDRHRNIRANASGQAFRDIGGQAGAKLREPDKKRHTGGASNPAKPSHCLSDRRMQKHEYSICRWQPRIHFRIGCNAHWLACLIDTGRMHSKGRDPAPNRSGRGRRVKPERRSRTNSAYTNFFIIARQHLASSCHKTCSW